MAQRRSEDAIEKIAPLVKHEDLIVATETVKALGQMRRPSADKVLRQAATSDARAAVRQEAVLQLGGARDAESRAVAKQAVKTDPDADVRASAITSIQKQRALDDVPLLLEVAETEKDVVVQARAVSAIEQMLHMKFNYDPKAPLAERQQALERIRASASRIAAELKERQRAMGTKR
jgi:HEAT repeat protein